MDEQIADLIRSLTPEQGVENDIQPSEEEKRINRNKREMEEKGYQVSPGIPWRRYFARCFDSQIGVASIAALLSIMIYTITKDLMLLNDSIWFICFAAYVLYIFIEALMIKLTGTTFGKFTMGITVVTSNYDRNYTYHQLLRRGFLVFLKGLGLNIPIVNIVTLLMSKSYVNHDESGQASWDFDCETLVAYKQFTLVNYFLIIVNIIISFSLIVANAVI